MGNRAGLATVLNLFRPRLCPFPPSNYTLLAWAVPMDAYTDAWVCNEHACVQPCHHRAQNKPLEAFCQELRLLWEACEPPSNAIVIAFSQHPSCRVSVVFHVRRVTVSRRLSMVSDGLAAWERETRRPKLSQSHVQLPIYICIASKHNAERSHWRHY